MLEIKLDAGKTAGDFSVVGLWCERLSANFGQATLVGKDGSANAGTGTMTEAPAASKTGAGTKSSSGVAVGVVVAIGTFVVLLV